MKMNLGSVVLVAACTRWNRTRIFSVTFDVLSAGISFCAEAMDGDVMQGLTWAEDRIGEFRMVR